MKFVMVARLDPRNPETESSVEFDVPDDWFSASFVPSHEEIAERYFVPAGRALFMRMRQRSREHEVSMAKTKVKTE